MNPLTPNTTYCPHSFTDLRVTNVLWTSEAEEQCVRIQPQLSSQVFAHWPIYHESKHIPNGMSTEDVQLQQQETKGVQQREAAEHQKC
jgi:hypothetical protein